ncbi:MAG TPA: hypothetical protein VFG14_00945, partial [Chthoniobacteraceae bacterium]|nr:hypothetical protein [Chthoniobacteraceae bacterium]
EQWRLNNAPDAVLENLGKVYSESKLPEWAQRTALGSNEIRLAWNARGGGYADSVTEDGWKGFREHLEKARKELVAAWKLRPDRPEAAARMIEVVLGQDSKDDHVRNWFDRAVAAQFDYSPAYSGILRAYLPRWGGSLELMIEFGRACRDTRRYDTSVPLVFLEAVHDVVNEIDDRRALYEHVPGLAREVAELGEALAREPTRAAEKKNWLSYGCVQAWLGREYEMASRLFKEIGGRLSTASERDVPVYGVTPHQFALDLELHASKAGADFDKGEKLFDEDDVEAAREAFVSAEKIAPEPTKPLVRSRIDVIDFERQLARGEWVKVTPKPGLFEWKARGGAWEATEDGTIVSHGSTYRGLLLFRGRVGPDYELRGEFEAESDADSDRRFGLVTGSREPAADGVEFSTYQVAGGATALVAPLKGGLPTRPKQTPFTFKPKNQFLLRVEDGRTTYEVNGETLFPSAEAPPQIAQFEASHFGFTGAIVRSGNVTRVRNIEVRRLPKRL